MFLKIILWMINIFFFILSLKLFKYNYDIKKERILEGKKTMRNTVLVGAFFLCLSFVMTFLILI